MQRFLRNIVKAALLGFSVYGIVVLIFFFSGSLSRDFNLDIASKGFYEHLVFSVLLYFANVTVWQFCDTRFSSSPYSLKHRFFRFLASFLISIIAIFVGRVFLKVGVDRQGLMDFIVNEKPIRLLPDTAYYHGNCVIVSRLLFL